VPRAGRGARRLPGAVEVARQPPRREPEQEAVTVAVHPDPVPGRRDLTEQRARAAHLLADDEEGGRRPVLAQHLQHGRRAARMRAVVEGQRHRGRQLEAPRDAQHGAHRRHDGGEGGRAPRRSEGGGHHGAGAERARAAACLTASVRHHVRAP